MPSLTMSGGTPTIPGPDGVGAAYSDVVELYDSVAGVPTFVLADPRADDRWLAVPAGVALSLEEWR